MYCGKCGAYIKDDSKFCGKCGAGVVAETTAVANNELPEDSKTSVNIGAVSESGGNVCLKSPYYAFAANQQKNRLLIIGLTVIGIMGFFLKWINAPIMDYWVGYDSYSLLKIFDFFIKINRMASESGISFGIYPLLCYLFFGLCLATLLVSIRSCYHLFVNYKTASGKAKIAFIMIIITSLAAMVLVFIANQYFRTQSEGVIGVVLSTTATPYIMLVIGVVGRSLAGKMP
jgi:hypothetical protein